MGKVISIIRKVLNLIANIEKVFGIVAMAFIVLINMWGILSRYLFNRPLIFIHELTILAGVWIFFIGMGLVFKNHSEITINFFVRILPDKLRLIIEVLTNVSVIVFAITLSYLTWKYIPYTRMASNVMSFALELPDEIYFYPVGLVGISIIISFTEKLIKSIDNLRKGFSNNLKSTEG